MRIELFEILKDLDAISDHIDEDWSCLDISGTFTQANTEILSNFNKVIDSLQYSPAIHYHSGNTNYSFQDFIEILPTTPTWLIHVNKLFFLNPTETDYGSNFFYDKASFIKWIKKSDPFSEDFPLNTDKKIVIFCNWIKQSFGNWHYIVCSPNTRITFDAIDDCIPDKLRILDYVHVISNERICISPANLYVSFGNLNEDSFFFFRNSCLILIACLCNEIYDKDNILLRGIRRIPMKLSGTNELTFKEEYQKQLLKAVKWVYSDNEKCDLRLKLLLERITLDISIQDPLFLGLQLILQSSLEQAMERYSFIIYERKDLFHSELKDLLKDLKSLTELYSQKVRNILTNILRDVLAAIVLIGISLFSTVTDITKLFDNKLIEYAFYSFGIYFLTSSIFQIIVDFIDIHRSNKEFDYWQIISREYMSLDDFKTHKSKTINKRAVWSVITYLIIFLFYIALAVICFNIKYIYNTKCN